MDRLSVRIHVSPVRARVAERAVRWTAAGRAQVVPAQPDALLRFCRLRRAAPDDAYVDYAGRWGVLGEAIRKRFASREFFSAALAEIDTGMPAPRSRFPREPRVLGDDEPIWLWRIAAAKTRALAVLCVALAGSRPDLESYRLWQTATVDHVAHPPARYQRVRERRERRGEREERERRERRDLNQRRELLDLLLEDWFHMSGVRERVNKEVHGSGAIGAAMALVWVGLHTSSGLAACDLPGCSEPFLPNRKRVGKRLSFCPEHAKKGRSLLSKWKSRDVLEKHLKLKEDGDE